MGCIVPNQRRRVTNEVNGRKLTSVELNTLVHGTIVRVKEGEEGSRVDGSIIATAFVSIKPGVQARITGYGDHQFGIIMDLKPGDMITALCTQMNRRDARGFRLEEFTAIQKAPEPALEHTTAATGTAAVHGSESEADGYESQEAA